MYFLTQENELKFSTPFSVMYFYSTWMPNIQHKKMLSMIEKIENKYDDVFFFAIDVDFFMKICQKYKVESIPTIIIMNTQSEIKRINGVVLTSAFKSVFADIYNGSISLSMEK